MTDYLTVKLPGIGGLIKEDPEDFLVEEIPLYPPCGAGEHLFVEVEKRGMTTFDLLQRLARALGIKERDFGYAGLKDARAITRQSISMTGVRPEQVLALDLAGIRILSARYHGNKLRLGHLAGNRFTIRIRQVGPAAGEQALDILQVLTDLGVPNRFGRQRYGVLGNSHHIGAALLRRDYAGAMDNIIGDPTTIQNPRWQQAASAFAAGDLKTTLDLLPGRQREERQLVRSVLEGKSPQEAVLALPRKLLRLYLSAYQSALFDRVVTMRLDSMATLWPGDLACKHANGACFHVDDPAAEQGRVDAFEISPTGPLFGCKLTRAKGQAGILEDALLEKEGLTLAAFRLGGGLDMEGERRPLRVPLSGVEVATEESSLRLSFALPKGSYATSVLREVVKGESAATALSGGENP